MAKRSAPPSESTETSLEPLSTYECLECGARTEAAHHPPMCERCGGEMQNLSVTRGQ